MAYDKKRIVIVNKDKIIYSVSGEDGIASFVCGGLTLDEAIYIYNSRFKDCTNIRINKHILQSVEYVDVVIEI